MLKKTALFSRDGFPNYQLHGAAYASEKDDVNALVAFPPVCPETEAISSRGAVISSCVCTR